MRVTFSEPVKAYAGAALSIVIGGSTRTVSLTDETAHNSPTLDFSYVVINADSDSDGITVATDALAGTYTHDDAGVDDTAATLTLPNTLATAQASHRVNVPINYDRDGDGLIDIESLAQLNAVRWDLDRNGQQGSVSASNWAMHTAAFAHAVSGLGCPASGCAGYELLADLDFDDDGSGSVDSSDAYPNWTPIGTSAAPFTSTFRGNGHTIANMTIDATDIGPVGLFGEVRNGAIEGVGNDWRGHNRGHNEQLRGSSL